MRKRRTGIRGIATFLLVVCLTLAWSLGLAGLPLNVSLKAYASDTGSGAGQGTDNESASSGQTGVGTADDKTLSADQTDLNRDQDEEDDEDWYDRDDEDEEMPTGQQEDPFLNEDEQPSSGEDTGTDNSQEAQDPEGSATGQGTQVQEEEPPAVIALQVKVAKSAKKYSKSIKVGDQIELSVLSGSASVDISKCKFSSSKKSVASVSKKGVIKAKKKGKAVITVKVKDGKKTRKAKITVKVKARQSGSSGKASTVVSKKTRKGAPGKRTIKAYLQNALVPCGRTLYIYGGGWGSYGAKIGYQSSWKEFFEDHAGSGYRYQNYKFKRSKGFDCSGFAGWTLYNTLYSRSGKGGLAVSSSVVAKNYASKGWATLAKNSKDKIFKPGDVVSKGGHVWISLGQCSDGSVLIIHSTPQSGVQISGTRGKAADLARYYMKKYFPNWPYTAKQMGSSYWKYKSRARWKVKGSGSILSDPDGIQEMSGEQVLQLLLGR